MESTANELILELRAFGVAAIDIFLLLLIFPELKVNLYYYIPTFVLIISTISILFYMWLLSSNNSEKRWGEIFSDKAKIFDFNLKMTAISLILIFMGLEYSFAQSLISRFNL